MRNERLNLIDLFAGCGGMSTGFEFAGFKTVLAVEKDEWASETYSFNHPHTNIFTGDIKKIKNPNLEFAQTEDVFGIIGGPPCQGFSLSGARDPKDPRNSLFMDYMRFVKSFSPKFFVMENVTGILSAKTKSGDSVKKLIELVADEVGYNVHIMILDASDYGVPQARKRVFFVGIRKDLPFIPDRLVPPKITPINKVTIRQALSDLPKLNSGEGCEWP